MPPEESTKLRWMLEAAQTALVFSEGRSRADLETHQMYFYAVVKAVELVGEAATKVTTSTQLELESILWRKITSMRNILVHNFHGIEKDILWESIQNDMPNLISELEVVLARQDC